MKKLTKALFLMVILAITLVFASCGQDAPPQTPNENPGAANQDMSGVIFEGASATYDGTEKTIEVSGLPEGASVIYSPSNSYKEAGSYNISAKITKAGYNDLTLEATLVIAPKEIDIEWSEIGPFFSTGEAPEINYTVVGAVAGDIVDIEISFGECDFTTEGTFNLTATSKNPNYVLKEEDKSIEFTVGTGEHTVIFDTGLEDEESETKTVNHNGTVTKPRKDPSKRGYEFIGWYLGDEEWNFDAPITEDITLIAKWKATEYNITYHLDGGTNSESNPKTFSLETDRQLEAPTKEGYVFLGWFSDSSLETPAAALGSASRDIALYAKWAQDDYTELVKNKDLNPENSILTLSEPAANGSFNYIFTANISDFEENGAIYIGRGYDSADGSYIKITSDQIIVCTNGIDGTVSTDTKTHSRDMNGYIVIELTAREGKVSISIQTSNGKTLIDSELWSGRRGEIFVKAENASFDNASLGWYSAAYDNPVWIIGDESVGRNDSTSYTYHLTEYNYTDFLAIAAVGIDSAEALELFNAALKKATPEYAVWSFAVDTADTLKNLNSFIDICKNNSITPILTTQPEEFDADNDSINSSVKASGERYIDFATMAKSEGAVTSGKYTELGAKLLYTKFLVDFPEITTGAEGLRYDTAPTLSGDIDDRLELSGNTIKDGKYLIFSAKLDSMEEDDLIIVGHGYMTYNGAWFEIGPDTFDLYNYYSYTDPKKQTIVGAEPHGLEIKNFITVILTCNFDKGGSTITIATDGGFYSYNKLGKGQSGNDGDMVALSSGVELTDCSLAWTCVDYSKDVWIFGDSYLGTTNASRWPYYMYQDNYQNALMSGYAGMASKTALKDFKDAIQYAVPKYVIWCMGMNDGDSATINPNYYSATMEMLEICKSHGIIPVIATIPTCLAVDNTVKNSYINEKLEGFGNYDYLIVDFARAVNGYVPKAEATWYDDMLYSDNVHPAVLGAKALYMQFVADFPEIMGGWNVTVYKENADFLYSSDSITITSPSEIEKNKIYTFSADYNGEFRGAIEIGNDKSTDGATWIKIDSTYITVYRNIGGKDTEIKTVEHNALLLDLINVKIHVVGYTANISIIGAGETAEFKNDVFNFDTSWTFAGDISATAVNVDLTDVSLSFFTSK